MKTWTRHNLGIISLLILSGAAGCGRTGLGEAPGAAAAANDENGYRRVVGRAAFGNQCHFGSFSTPDPVPLDAWYCKDMPVEAIELQDGPQPLLFSMDCRKKLLTVRSQDGKINTAWEVKPNGTFIFSLDENFKAKIKDDGLGHLGCTAYIDAQVEGTADCADVDRPVLKFSTVFWLARGKAPTVVSRNATVPTAGPSSTPASIPLPGSEEVRCSIPDSCYMYTETTMNQCR